MNDDSRENYEIELEKKGPGAWGEAGMAYHGTKTHVSWDPRNESRHILRGRVISVYGNDHRLGNLRRPCFRRVPIYKTSYQDRETRGFGDTNLSMELVIVMQEAWRYLIKLVILIDTDVCL